MELYGILGIFSGVGVMAGFSLAAYFFVQYKKVVHSNYLMLTLLFIAIALRIGKSIAFFILTDVADYGLAIGFLGLSLIGPTIYFYYAKSKENIVALWRVLVHFSLPVVGMLSCFFLNLDKVTVLYQSATVILWAYLLLTWIRILKTGKTDNWNMVLICSISMVALAFAIQHLTETMMAYAWGAAFAASALYLFFYYALLNPATLKKAKKEIVLSKEQRAKIMQTMQDPSFFRRSGITLSTISTELDIPAYLISKVINALFQQTFPEAINEKRVEWLKKELMRAENAHLTIEALAYDAGFGTPSAFYAAFKKVTGVSPGAFKKAQMQMAMVP